MTCWALEPKVIYLTKVDDEDTDYPMVWASASKDSGGTEYIRADRVAALVEAGTYLLRAVDLLMSERMHPITDLHLMVRQTAKIQSVADARAALAAMEGGDG
jgi:hypothetical protein